MATRDRFFAAPAHSFFLFGPRGTGKTTWLRAQFPDALFIDLLQTDTQRLYAARPERLRQLVLGRKTPTLIVIDEIQKVPQLLDEVHFLIEHDKTQRFALTGSSARKLKHTGVDLLAGRALRRTMPPFMAAELASDFSLECALQLGMLPLVLDSPTPEQTLASYAGLYLREEVQQEGLVRDLGNFARFLEAVSFSHAAVLSVTDVARECQVNRKTVEGYIDILEDLLLSYRLRVFTRRAQRHLSSHPKFYFFDAGVYRSLRPTGPLDRPAEIDGAALEGLVAQHLCAWIAYNGDRHQLYFWRTKAGNEVDFVVYGPDGLWAIEVKNARDVRPKDLRGLKEFAKDYPEAQRCLLYRGEDRLQIDGILCLPCAAFLRELVPQQGLF